MSEAPSPLWESKQVRPSELRIVGYQIDRIQQLPKDMYVAGEIVEYHGKRYKLQGSADSTDGLNAFDAEFQNCDAKGEDWFVVTDFTSEKLTRPTPVVFVELKEGSDTSSIDTVATYREAVELIIKLY